MQLNAKRILSPVIWWLVAALMAGGGLGGCSYIPFLKKDKAQENKARLLWQSGEQFVAIQKQDRPLGGVVKPNEHVSEISVDRIRSAFASIDLRLPDKDKSLSLFNEDELRVLSEYVTEGFALAAPDEDITFAVIGNYVEALGFLKKRMVTTGRVFCQDGQLNIIFGDIHRELTATMGVPEDRRLNPFLPGLREGNEGKRVEGFLIPKKNGEIFAKMREDWVLFPIKSEALYNPNAAQEGATTASGEKEAAPAASRESRTPLPETRSSAPVGSYEKQAPVAKKSVEERLMILNELRNKKMITEEEYKAKRLDILNDL